MEWFISLIFAPFILPFVLIGVGMSGVELYQFFRRTPRLGRSEPGKAFVTTFCILLFTAFWMIIPRIIASWAPIQIVTAVITCWYFGAALWYSFKWGRIIVRLEDTDPTNDPGRKCPRADCPCDCHGKSAAKK